MTLVKICEELSGTSRGTQAAGMNCQHTLHEMKINRNILILDVILFIQKQNTIKQSHLHFVANKLQKVMKEIRLYKTDSGKEPFEDWLTKIKEKTTKARIRRRVDRLSFGHEHNTGYRLERPWISAIN